MKTNQEPRLIYLLPNLMTAGNLFFGFMAVLEIFQGTITKETDAGDWVMHYERSLLFILAAFICDMFDGRLARFSGQESPFGREFDSLADLISFGIAPALLVFKIVLYGIPNRIGWLIAFAYLACGALRLARFNVISAEAGTGGTKEFTGFPIPAAAGLISSITLMLLHIYDEDRDIGNWKWLLAAMMLFLSYMMFSKYRYPSFKTIAWGAKGSIFKLLAGIFCLTLVIMFYQYSLAIVFTLYLLYGFLRPHVSKAWRKEIESHEEAGEEDEDSSS